MRHQKCCFVDQSFGLYSVLLLVKSRRLPRIRRIIAKRSGEERIDHTFGSCGTCDWVKGGGGESLIRILEASVCLQASCVVMTLNPELRLLCDCEGAWQASCYGAYLFAGFSCLRAIRGVHEAFPFILFVACYCAGW